MNKNLGNLIWRSLVFNSLVVTGISISNCDRVFAQVIPDNTLGNESSTVNPRDETSDNIEGGAIRGQNLFHSFQEFNVNAGRGVYFSNPEAVTNIFSRVTGSNPSNILGTLGVDGAANLFLINPNGIIFGEGASLDVQGSFAATTASGVEFGTQGSFDAINPQIPQLLTINPSAYLFNQIKETASIESKSLVPAGETAQETEFLELRVPDGQNLFLLGGDIRLDGLRLNAFGGKVELGGLKEPGKVDINADDSLIFPENVVRGDVSLTKQSRVDVLGDSGSIKIEAGNINLSDLSFLIAGIESNSEQVNPQADDIILDATDKIEIIDNSSVRNSVGFNTTGNAGNIEISSNSLLLDNSTLNSNVSGSDAALDITAGQRNTGNILIQVNDSVIANSGYISNILTDKVIGNAGNITIKTGTLSLTEGANITTRNEGEGNLGNINIQANDFVSISGTDTTEVIPLRSHISNTSSIDGTTQNRQGGDIIIDARSIFVADNAFIDSSIADSVETKGKIILNASEDVQLSNGSFININNSEVAINAKQISLTDFASINSITSEDFIIGNKVKLVASDKIAFSNESGIYTRSVNKNNSIFINTNDLKLLSDSYLISGTLFEGLDSLNYQAGDININATGKILVESSDIADTAQLFNQGAGGNINIQADTLILTNPSLLDSLRSQIRTNTSSLSNGGNINIDVRQLTLQEGSTISTSTFPEAQGKGGNLTITASEFVELIGNSALEVPPTSLLSQSGGMGDGGDVTVETNELIIRDGAGISTQTFAEGEGGNISIVSPSIKLMGASSNNFSGLLSQTSGLGNAGDIQITSKELTIQDGAGIYTQTFAEGEGGNISIISPSIKLIGTSSSKFPTGLFSTTSGTFTNEMAGDAGDIQIVSEELTIQDGASIDASTAADGQAGDITIKASDVIKITGSILGNIPSSILTTVFNNPLSGDIGTGNGGNLALETDKLIIQDGGEINAQTESEGNAGAISVTAQELLLDDAGLISTRSFGNGSAGNITLNIIDALEANDSNINTSSEDSTGGQINVSAENITLKGDSDIRTNVSNGTDNGGNITLTADSIIAFDNSDIFAFARDGKGGNITLNTPVFFAENFTLNSLTAEDTQLLENNDRADVNATGAVSSGSVEIPDVSFIQNSLTELPNNSIDTDELVANSCVVPVGNRSQGKFVITGGESLPVRPGDNLPSKFSTGEVRSVPKDNNSSWQPGDPIIEPQGAYRLANGKVVLSRECSQ